MVGPITGGQIHYMERCEELLGQLGVSDLSCGFDTVTSNRARFAYNGELFSVQYNPGQIEVSTFSGKIPTELRDHLNTTFPKAQLDSSNASKYVWKHHSIDNFFR